MLEPNAKRVDVCSPCFTFAATNLDKNSTPTQASPPSLFVDPTSTNVSKTKIVAKYHERQSDLRRGNLHHLRPRVPRGGHHHWPVPVSRVASLEWIDLRNRFVGGQQSRGYQQCLLATVALASKRADLTGQQFCQPTVPFFVFADVQWPVDLTPSN